IFRLLDPRLQRSPVRVDGDEGRACRGSLVQGVHQALHAPSAFCKLRSGPDNVRAGHVFPFRSPDGPARSKGLACTSRTLRPNMNTPRRVLREYDTRGVADVDLSDELARALGKTFAHLLRGEAKPGGPPLRFAVGRDGRLSSDRLFAALSEGLLEGGVNVISV